jgi:hypothetical protein
MLWASFYWFKNGISYTIKLVRFAHNWNVGIMGSGKMGYWSIGKIPLDREAIKCISSLFKPIFQYSIWTT